MTSIDTPGNVVRSSQTLCKWNPYGSSRSWHSDLQTVNKQVKYSMDFMFCHFSQVAILKSGNVVPNSFHFYARLNEYGSGKSNGVFLNRFLPGEV